MQEEVIAEVVELIVGDLAKKRLIPRHISQKILALILSCSAQDNKKIEALLHSLSNSQGFDRSFVTNILKALMLVCSPENPTALMEVLLFKTTDIFQVRECHVIYEAVVVAMVESVNSLKEHQLLTADQQKWYPKQLATFVFQYQYPSRFEALDTELSGRLSNASGKFLENVDSMIFFREIFLNRSEMMAPLVRSSIVAEFIAKQTMKFSMPNRLYFVTDRMGISAP